jgi:anti-sigma factor RsiW
LVEAELTCQELVEIVTEYLENKLPPADHRRFAAHLANCKKCTRYVEQMRTVIKLSGKLSEEAIDPKSKDDLLEVFRDWRQDKASLL